MAINGNNIFVLLNNVIIAGTKTNEIQSDCEMIEISNPSSGEWKQFMAGRKNWVIQTGFLLQAVTNIRQLLNIGTSYTIIVKDRNSTSGASVTGTAILKTCKITATIGNLVQGSFVFQGTGALS